MGEEAEFVIDRLRPEDLEQVLAIEQASFSQPWTRKLFENEFKRSVVSASLAAYAKAGQEGKGRTVVGYIVFWVVVDEMHILNLAVAPSQRRKGIGTKLVRAALRQAYGLGARRAFLEVRASNEAAQRLYASLGFAGIGLRRGYYSMPPEDAVVMSLSGEAFGAVVKRPPA